MNNDKTQKITIIREHEKLVLLEQLLNDDTELEHLVSEYIDLSIHNQPKIDCFRKIKNKTNNILVLSKIIQLCSSIAFDKPIKISVPINETTLDIIKYINEPYPPLFV